MPAKIGLHPLKDTLMHAMPTFLPKGNACGIKWASCFPDNSRRGLPQTSGLLILNDQYTGWPIAVMDAIWITARRTAAVTAIACKYLARKDAAVLGIIGTGVQGEAHVEFLPKILKNLELIKVYDIRTEVLSTFVGEYADKVPCSLSPAQSYRQLVEDADVVVSATAILQKPNPQVRDEWIKEGAFIAPIDFDSLWEYKTMVRVDKFLVDSIDEMRYFESIGYLPNGLPPVYAEIGEVVAGLKLGREENNECIMDMNIGMGVEDVVVAREIYNRALHLDVGIRLPL